MSSKKKFKSISELVKDYRPTTYIRTSAKKKKKKPASVSNPKKNTGISKANKSAIKKMSEMSMAELEAYIKKKEREKQALIKKNKGK